MEAKKKSRIGRYIGRLLLVVATTAAAAVVMLAIIIGTICRGPSEAGRDLFVTTVLESGQMKFLASLFLSEEEIADIVSKTSMGTIDTNIDTGLIHLGDGDGLDGAGADGTGAGSGSGGSAGAGIGAESGSYDENGIEIVEISGRTYYAKMMIVKNPAQVKLATTYPWTEYGQELSQLVENSGAVAGVNGGLYVSNSNKGGSPLGLAVCEGQIQFNKPDGWIGLYLIGFDEDNILQILDIEGETQSSLAALIKEKRIRDAVAFQDEASDANNHFVPLVINGVARELNGQGSGANPRTAIGQRADGSVLLLVTDGRGAAGHLGATASDLIEIMLEYGAVNAANLDGGSSSCMYYNDNYEMTSVTLYYANSSWRLPTAFVVEGQVKGE